MPSIPVLTDALADRELMLRAAAERDIPEILIAYQDDPELHLRLGEARPPSGAQLGTRAERAAAELAAGTCARFTILEGESDDCRGQIALHHLDWDNARGELEIWVAPQLRRRGIARRTLRLAARWVFDACGIVRLAVLVAPDNTPMLHAARAAGFADEGTLRGYVRERAARADRAVLSLLATDLLG